MMIADSIVYLEYVVPTSKIKIEHDSRVTKYVMTLVSTNQSDNWYSPMYLRDGEPNAFWAFQRYGTNIYIKLQNNGGVTYVPFPTWTQGTLGIDMGNMKMLVNTNTYSIPSSSPTPLFNLWINVAGVRIYKVQSFDANEAVVDEFLPAYFNKKNGLYGVNSGVFHAFD